MRAPQRRQLVAAVVSFAVITVGVASAFFVERIDSLYSLLGLREVSAVIALPEDSPLLIHVLDVGQGDSILIQTAEQTVLVDAGEQENASKIAAYLDAHEITALDWVIATHPHADHIGALFEVAREFGAETVMVAPIPEELTERQSSYQPFAQAFADGTLGPVTAIPNDVYDLGGGVTLTILGPLRNDYDELNLYSVVCRVDYQDASFLLTGDMEAKNETETISAYEPDTLRADVLKLGHHGSKTSSTARWLDAVSPAVAVASLGRDNSYGHPNDSVVQRLQKRGISFYRTDLDGTVVFATDGKNISIYPANGSDPETLAA